MHAFAPSRPLLLAIRPTPSPTCKQRATVPQRPTLRPTSQPRAIILSSDAGPHSSSASSMASSQTPTPPLSQEQNQPIPDIASSALASVDDARVATVRAQMEFWFSPSNLRRDWYLRRQMDEQGWLDPSIFLLFNRIKNLNATLTDIILACKSSDELEVSTPEPSPFGDDAAQTRVRRSPELPDFRQDDDKEVARSFILRGIPQDSTIESLLQLFKPLGNVSYARIYRSKNFPDGPRALICFPDREGADNAYHKFVTEKPIDLVGIRMRRRDRSLAKVSTSSSTSTEFEPKSNFLILHITGLSPELDWKSMYKALHALFSDRTGESMRYLMYSAGAEHCYVTCTDSEAVRTLIAELTTNGLEIGTSSAAVTLLEDEEEVKDYWKMATEHQAARKARRAREGPISSSESMRRPPGVIVKVDGLDGEANWRDLRLDLSRLGQLIFVNFRRGSTCCYVRFSSAEEASAARDALSSPDPVTVCGNVVKATVLEGEEEREYWKRAEELQQMRRNSRDSPPVASA